MSQKGIYFYFYEIFKDVLFPKKYLCEAIWVLLDLPST
jgi:hypothetical protein